MKLRIHEIVMIFAMIVMLSGCGGTIGEVGGIKIATTASEYNSKGWDAFDSGAYLSAKQSFERALALQSSDLEKADANNGLGWSITRLDGIREARVYFQNSAKYFNDAKIGLAGAFLSGAVKSDYEKGIEYLEQIGLSSTDYIYKSAHEIGVSNAEAHAMLGVLYYFSGNTIAANEQITKARRLDNNIGSSVDEIVKQFQDGSYTPYFH